MKQEFEQQNVDAEKYNVEKYKALEIQHLNMVDSTASVVDEYEQYKIQHIQIVEQKNQMELLFQQERKQLMAR